ncbi:MAG: hypothetical protein WCI05_15535 [Myxococcales bacterium]
MKVFPSASAFVPVGTVANCSPLTPKVPEHGSFVARQEKPFRDTKMRGGRRTFSLPVAMMSVRGPKNDLRSKVPETDTSTSEASASASLKKRCASMVACPFASVLAALL